MTSDTDRAHEATDLLQHLIRNACVNDGTPASGQEVRSADLLATYLEGSGVELETYEPSPGRKSLVAKISGTDPTAPSLTLLGHTDVVPANGDDWTHDPFGGELIDGEVWGRGAIDMLNLTTTMATGLRHLARDGFRPAGDLTYIAVADEEALSTFGAKWLCANAADDIRTDYVITESGGFPMNGTDGLPRLPVIVGEKGVFWCVLTVTGTPGHASQPLRTDNALVKAAEVVRRIDEYRPQAELHEAWTRFVGGLGFPPELTEPLLDPGRIDAFCDELPLLGLARQAHACTHTTMAPTIMRAGTKTNVIPDRVELEVDIRALPGWETGDVRAMLVDVLGDLADDVQIAFQAEEPASTSPIDTPLWDAISRVSSIFYPGSTTVPFLTVGGDRRPLHPHARLGLLRVRAPQSCHRLRAVRRHVPRDRRARRRGVAPAVDRDVDGARPRLPGLTPASARGDSRAQPTARTSRSSSSSRWSAALPDAGLADSARLTWRSV